jgi:hypothetical protein
MSDESSDNISNVNKTIDSVTALVKAIPIYEDLVQPAAKEIGKTLQTLGKTVNMALAPVSALVWGYEQIRDFVSVRVSEKLQNVSPEDIITPKPNVAGPALEALRYTGHDPNLSDMYANLIASSMDKNTADGAHPAFVEIIRQLTPDEAKIIRHLNQKIAFPIITISTKYKEIGKDGVKLVFSKFSYIGEDAGCEISSLTPSYLDNICRLGLASIPVLGEYTKPGTYDRLENSDFVKKIKEDINKSEQYEPLIERQSISLTDLGKQFSRICVSRDK